jgi:hypothetical protein
MNLISFKRSPIFNGVMVGCEVNTNPAFFSTFFSHFVWSGLFFFFHTHINKD